jgi:hypothetical protein
VLGLGLPLGLGLRQTQQSFAQKPFVYLGTHHPDHPDTFSRLWTATPTILPTHKLISSFPKRPEKGAQNQLTKLFFIFLVFYLTQPLLDA